MFRIVPLESHRFGLHLILLSQQVYLSLVCLPLPLEGCPLGVSNETTVLEVVFPPSLIPLLSVDLVDKKSKEKHTKKTTEQGYLHLRQKGKRPKRSEENPPPTESQATPIDKKQARKSLGKKKHGKRNSDDRSLPSSTMCFKGITDQRRLDLPGKTYLDCSYRSFKKLSVSWFLGF